MTINLSSPFVIISAARPDKTAAELDRDGEQLANIARSNGYTVTPCVGVFAGETEPSFLISGKGNANAHPLAELGAMLCGVYNQDCFLVYDGIHGWLVNRTGDCVEYLPKVSSKIDSPLQPHTRFVDGTVLAFS
jgi:hypothetical protein